MPELHSLVINEISLVDHPANCEIDPKTGKKIPRATIAIYKRDSSAASNAMTERRDNMQEFEQVLKSVASTREEIAGAVEEEALKIAKRAGCSLAKARTKVWNETGAHEAYEAAPPAKPKKRERKMIRVTKAEGELDRLARLRVRKTGEHFAVAAREVLTEHPEIYTQYLREQAAGRTYNVPEPRYDFPDYYSGVGKQGDGADDGEEEDGEEEDGADGADTACPKCDAATEKGDRFCAKCGSKL